MLKKFHLPFFYIKCYPLDENHYQINATHTKAVTEEVCFQPRPNDVPVVACGTPEGYVEDPLSSSDAFHHRLSSRLLYPPKVIKHFLQQQQQRGLTDQEIEKCIFEGLKVRCAFTCKRDSRKRRYAYIYNNIVVIEETSPTEAPRLVTTYRAEFLAERDATDMISDILRGLHTSGIKSSAEIHSFEKNSFVNHQAFEDHITPALKRFYEEREETRERLENINKLGSCSGINSSPLADLWADAFGFSPKHKKNLQKKLSTSLKSPKDYLLKDSEEVDRAQYHFSKYKCERKWYCTPNDKFSTRPLHRTHNHDHLLILYFKIDHYSVNFLAKPEFKALFPNPDHSISDSKEPYALVSDDIYDPNLHKSLSHYLYKAYVNVKCRDNRSWYFDKESFLSDFAGQTLVVPFFFPSIKEKFSNTGWKF